MIDKNKLLETVNAAIADTSLFIVECKVTPDNVVTVTVDSPDGVDIDTCMAISHAIGEVFDRDVEDYELEVGSAGVTASFTVPQQYRMNIGNTVEILTSDGRKMHAVLTGVSDDNATISVTVATKVKEPGQKKPKMVDVPMDIPVGNIKRIVREIEF